MGAAYGGGGVIMTKERFAKGGIIKYVVLVLIVIFIVILMLYTSGSSKPFEEIRQSVASVLDKSNLKEKDEASFKRNTGLNAADYSGVMYYASESNLSAEEVLLIRVRSGSQIQEVRETLEARIDSCISDFDGYVPEEVKLLEEAVLNVRGNYIFFAVAPKAGEYLEAFRNSL